MRLFRAFTVLACCTLFCLPAMCAQLAAAPHQPVTSLENGRVFYPIRSAQVIVDDEKAFSLEEIRRLETLGKAPWTTAEKLNFGYSPARYWLKVEVTNTSSIERNWILEFSYPLIQILHVYRFGDDETPVSWLTGRLSPFGSRPIAHRNFLFNFSSAKGSRTVFYLMLESSGTLLAPMAVYSQQEFLGRSVGSTAGIGLYCGVILAMVLFNLFLLLTSKDRNYLYYICYAFTFCLLMNTLNGITYQYLWPNMAAWNRVSVPILAGVCYLFLVLFTRSFLETRRHAPRLDQGLTIIISGALFLIVGGLFHYGLLVNKFTSFFISAAPLVVLPISIWCLRNGSQVAGYYSLAFSFFFIGAALRAARDLAWIPQSLFTDYGAYFGSAAEMLLLSLGLAARIRLLKDEKLRSELQAFEAERQLTDSKIELERQSAISSIAAQVAHDIRSPLAALGAAAKGLSLPGDQRTLIDGAIGRMQGIADDLLQRYRAPGVAVKAKLNTCALAGLIDQVLAEKRLQHKDKTGIKIEFSADAGGLKATVDAKELQRIISNLINNAIEAFPGAGTVAVSLAGAGGMILVEIKDDGKGIPPEILAKLGKKGETHGKAGGTGLGLHHARVSVESWGGSLKIESEPGLGTGVTITLPIAAKPAAGPQAALLDDDPLVHMNWRLAAKAAGAVLNSYKTPQEFAAAAETLPRDIPLYIDSELGNDLKGEDIAKDLHGKGFTDITMATGHGPDKFTHLPWLKVTGKEPPWA
ncbi:MAG: hypothetical protein CVU79_08050 [Elusimicrobia bacterium HGW-Elusimicrobia-3]|nr:MAG: hypothetical protein CVU79_08050 [Elusimicrobia bacterium HGW-Elusimicrobia-3]